MWKPEHRRAADRTGLRYPSDLSDGEWLIVEPMIPPAKRGGRRRSVNVREVLNGIFYILWTGCQWQALPKDLPPKSTVHDYLELWNWDGTLERIHHELYVAVREQEAREPSPTVAIIDSQTAKGSQKGGLGSILRATTRARRSKVANGTSQVAAMFFSAFAKFIKASLLVASVHSWASYLEAQPNKPFQVLILCSVIFRDRLGGGLLHRESLEWTISIRNYIARSSMFWDFAG